MDNFSKIQELLRKKADLQTRLNLIPYIGTPEIKENKSGKYLYVAYVYYHFDYFDDDQ